MADHPTRRRKRKRAMHNVNISKASILTPGRKAATGLVAALARSQGDSMANEEKNKDGNEEVEGVLISEEQAPFSAAVETAIDDEDGVAAVAREATGNDERAFAVIVARRALDAAGVDPDKFAEMFAKKEEDEAGGKIEGASEEVNEKILAREQALEAKYGARMEELDKRLKAETVAREASEKKTAEAESARERTELAVLFRKEMPNVEGEEKDVVLRLQRMKSSNSKEDFDAIVAGMKAESTARAAILGDKGHGDAHGSDDSEFEGWIKSRMESVKCSRNEAIVAMRHHKTGKAIHDRHNAGTN